MVSAPNNWLVSGGSGFLGTEICEQLYSHGMKVVNFDKVQPEYLYNWEYHNGTLSHPNDLKSIFKKVEFGVVHAAALKSVNDSINDPSLFEKNNFSDSVTFYEAMQNIGCKHFIFISSAAVYGDKRYEVRETDTCEPISKYGKTKYDFEQYLMEHKGQSDCNVTIIRPFNIVGVNSKGKLSGSVVTKIVSSKIFGSPFVSKYIFSPETKTDQRVEPIRDYIDVKDVARLVSQVCIGTRNSPRIINASTGNDTNLSSIIQIVENIGKPPMEIKYESMEKEEIPYSVGSNQVAKMWYEWIPETRLSESLRNEYDALSINEQLK
jgi:nucleoside-diphosphate-sugar epimerase